MAVMFSLAGGLLGFVSALVSLIVLEAGILAALLIWSVSGLGMVAMGLFAQALSRLGQKRTAPTASRPPQSGARTI